MTEISTSNESLNLDKILDGLNQAQRNAVTSDAGVLQILAPPGSGKTRTLTSRVAYLLANGMNPSNVIVATFTVKASKEMKERIGSMIGGGLEGRLILGTFHSIARRYLAKYGNLIGIPKGFGIADTTDTKNILQRIIKRNNFSGLEPGTTRSRISNLKAKTQTYEIYITTDPKSKSINNQEFSQVYKEYEEELKSSNLLDYDDLLLKCLELLKMHPICVSNIEAVLIDEFQDTNLVQLDLMCLLAAKRDKITIVGDPDQSIYGFRAAEIQNLSTMQRIYPDTIVIHLEKNYRSSAAILQCALEVIEQDKARPSKPLEPTHEIGTSPVLKRLPNAAIEAEWIVREIIRLRALTGHMVNFDDIAILIRTANLAKAIETKVMNAGIPYRLVAGTKFFERKDVKVVLDYLRVIHDPSDSEALVRIVNIPSRRLGDKTVKGLFDESYQRKKTMWELIRQGITGNLTFKTNLTKPAEQGLSQFVRVILNTQKMLKGVEQTEDKQDIGSVIRYLLKQIQYEQYLESKTEPGKESTWPLIEELILQATEFCENLANGIDDDELPDIEEMENDVEESKMSLALGKFLANAALASVKETADVKAEDGSHQNVGVLTISTIHNAKGLEWPVVFIPGCYEGSIPHMRADDTDEERRLLYVAMTRAQALLYMSYPCEFRDMSTGSNEESNLCKFLADKSIRPMLKLAGPKITPTTVLSWSKIMARECPDTSTIQSTIQMAGLESVDDEFCLLEENVPRYNRGGDDEDFDDDGQYYNDEGAYWDEYNHQEKKQKKSYIANNRSYSTNQYTASSTLHQTSSNTARFSSATTAMQGFKSAGSHFQNLATSKLECEADTLKKPTKRKSDSMDFETSSTTTSNDQLKSNKPKLARTKSKEVKVKPGQSVLDSFFKKPKPPSPIKEDPKFILLSSSPDRPPPAPRLQKSNSDVISENKKFLDRMRNNPPINYDIMNDTQGFTTASLISTSKPGLKKSYTAPTTMSRLSGSNTTTTTISSIRGNTTVSLLNNSGVKKTLGVKRSMNGWNDRHSGKN